MNQLGFLDFDIRLHRIDMAGDPLTKINGVMIGKYNTFNL